MVTKEINKTLLDGCQYDVVIIDVNSMFMFTKKARPVESLYKCIDSIKHLQNNKNILFINVIDNGLNGRMKRRFPEYKANRITSITTHRMGGFNKCQSKNKFKNNIDAIMKRDYTFQNHLTVFQDGESDFKIGYIINWILNYTNIQPSQILTIANDKDFVMASKVSDVLIKRRNDYTGNLYYRFNDNDKDFDTFRTLFKVKDLKMTKMSDFFYFLLLNGDTIDNIPPILKSTGKVIAYLNMLYDKYGYYNMKLICENIGQAREELNTNDIYDNSYLIDIFNPNVFTASIQRNLNWVLEEFFRRNKIKMIGL